MKTNWQTKKLGEVCNIYQPKTISAKEMVADGMYIVFGANGIIGRYNKYNHEEPQLLITCRGATCGSVNISQPKSWITGNAMVVRPKDTLLDLKYLEYIFRGGLDMSKVITGAAQPQITRANLEPVEISYPESLTEQRRIVKILDEVFEKTAKAKENAEKNLQNAKELFESYSQDVFADKKDKWDKKKLIEICIVERGSSPRPIKNYVTESSDGVNWIKIGDTKNIDRYLYKTNQKITKKGAGKSRFVKEGDLILSNSMSFGRPYIMKTSGYIHDGWFVLRPNSNLDTEYFYDAISSPQVQKQFIALASGSVVKNISGDLVKKAVLPIPSLSEQKLIVKKLDALSVETKKLEAIYKQKLADLEELKKSVLKKAFSGEL